MPFLDRQYLHVINLFLFRKKITAASNHVRVAANFYFVKKKNLSRARRQHLKLRKPRKRNPVDEVEKSQQKSENRQIVGQATAMVP